MNSKMVVLSVAATALFTIGIVLFAFQKSAQEPVEPAIPQREATSTFPVITTTYTTAVDWPPITRIVKEAYTCTEAGDVSARAGKTERRTIEGAEWCRTSISEGAAGSVYTQYAYATRQEDATRILTFSLRQVQCAHYDEPERLVCEAERAAFDPDTIISSMMYQIE